MSSNNREQLEFVDMVLAAAAGEATPEQLERLNRLVVEDEAWRLFFIELNGQEAWLTWHASQARTDLPLSRATEAVDESVRAYASPHVDAERSGSVTPDVVVRTWRTADIGQRRLRLSLAAAVLLATGATVGALASRWWTSGPGSEARVIAGLPKGIGEQSLGAGTSSAYGARLTQDTACVWGAETRTRLVSHNSLRSGDSVNLVEGLAELDLEQGSRGNTRLRLEGPAGLVLMADGGANLNFGKLVAEVSLQDGEFTLETPFGQVEVTRDAHIGVAVSAGTLEVHVLAGQARVVAPWRLGIAAPDGLLAESGNSIRLSEGEGGQIDVVRGSASLDQFASQMSMKSDLLEIPDEYVRTIKRAQPVCYWRFNGRDDAVKNEVADRYHAQVTGNLNWNEEKGNISAEFGADPQTISASKNAYLVADTPFQGIQRDSYTIELWAKPSHCHLGSMVALVTVGDNEKIPAGSHGALLELGGQGALSTIFEHPGRVRFLHRDPPGADASIGTSCFSGEPYKLRHWQHVVAVKDHAEMRLYVDTKKVATAKTDTLLPEGLELIVGQIDRVRGLRPYIGQLDELAFYDRALTDQEIEDHYRLVRPKDIPKRAI